MLWVVASLLTLVEDVFSEEDNKEAESELQRVFSRPSWSPTEELEQDSRIHTPWSGAVGEYFRISTKSIAVLLYFIHKCVHHSMIVPDSHWPLFQRGVSVVYKGQTER